VYAWATGKSAGRIVILGPGGTGKDTLAKILTSKDVPISLDLAKYKESPDIEQYKVKRKGGDEIEIVVLPGQSHRRETTWPEFLKKISSGEIRGIIFLTSYGYHSIGDIKISALKQWPGRKDRFLKAYLKDRISEELKVIAELLPAIKSSEKKVWLLTVTTKQDLWWKSSDEVRKHYTQGSFRKKLEELLSGKDALHMHAEHIFCSLTISNFVTGGGEFLQHNAEGYGLAEHSNSLHKLIEVMDGLRQWENR
jgi:hypothetical protein